MTARQLAKAVRCPARLVRALEPELRPYRGGRGYRLEAVQYVVIVKLLAEAITRGDREASWDTAVESERFDAMTLAGMAPEKRSNGLQLVHGLLCALWRLA